MNHTQTECCVNMPHTKKKYYTGPVFPDCHFVAHDQYILHILLCATVKENILI